MTPGEVLLDPKPQGLSAEQALHIARLDAEAAYGDLDDFRITIARQPDASVWPQGATGRRLKSYPSLRPEHIDAAVT